MAGTRRPRTFGWVLLGLGLFAPCLTCGLAFFVGPGIPFQDPTPTMLEQEYRQVRVADIVFAVGFAVTVLLFASGLWLVVRADWAERRRARASGGPPSA
jgi:hypothetical protein